MEISMCMPYWGRDYDRDTTLDWCRLVDEGPFAGISCGERITSHSQHMTVLMAAAAAITQRVRIIPSLYVLPLHSAALVAKEVASLDVLSGGRVEICVGVGGREHDYRAAGASFARRHQRLDEQVAELKRIWAGEPPFEGCDPIGPRPIQEGGPRVYSGAMGPKAMARAAKWADGIQGNCLNGNAQAARQSFEAADSAWAEAGRSDPPRRITGFWFSLSPNEAQSKLETYVYEYMRNTSEAAARAISKTMTTSTPEAVSAALDAIEEEGCEECFLVPTTTERAEVERAAELIDRR